MKEFDFVKFTLIVSVLLIVALAGGYLWLGVAQGDSERELEEVKGWLQRIGALSGEIDTLEEEKRKDKSAQFDTVFSYFHKMADGALINSDQDYDLDPRPPELHQGFKDQEFVLNFKSGREKKRQQLATFMYNVERNSPRYKLVKAKLQLDEGKATQDAWKATLSFLKRDPYSGDTRAQ